MIYGDNDRDEYGLIASTTCSKRSYEYDQTLCNNCGINPVWIKKPVSSFRSPSDSAICRIMDRKGVRSDKLMGHFRLTVRSWKYLILKYHDSTLKNPCHSCNERIDEAEKKFYPVDLRYTVEDNDDEAAIFTRDFWKKSFKQGHVCLRAITDE